MAKGTKNASAELGSTDEKLESRQSPSRPGRFGALLYFVPIVVVPFGFIAMGYVVGQGQWLGKPEPTTKMLDPKTAEQTQLVEALEEARKLVKDLQSKPVEPQVGPSAEQLRKYETDMQALMKQLGELQRGSADLSQSGNIVKELAKHETNMQKLVIKLLQDYKPQLVAPPLEKAPERAEIIIFVLHSRDLDVSLLNVPLKKLFHGRKEKFAPQQPLSLCYVEGNELELIVDGNTAVVDERKFGRPRETSSTEELRALGTRISERFKAEPKNRRRCIIIASCACPCPLDAPSWENSNLEVDVILAQSSAPLANAVSVLFNWSKWCGQRGGELVLAAPNQLSHMDTILGNLLARTSPISFVEKKK